MFCLSCTVNSSGHILWALSRNWKLKQINSIVKIMEISLIAKLEEILSKTKNGHPLAPFLQWAHQFTPTAHCVTMLWFYFYSSFVDISNVYFLFCLVSFSAGYSKFICISIIHKKNRKEHKGQRCHEVCTLLLSIQYFLYCTYGKLEPLPKLLLV